MIDVFHLYCILCLVHAKDGESIVRAASEKSFRGNQMRTTSVAQHTRTLCVSAFSFMFPRDPLLGVYTDIL